MKGLENAGITNMVEFLGEDQAYYRDLEYTDPVTGAHFLTKPETRMVMKIHAWMIWELQTYPNIDLETLTLDDYDEFSLNKTIVTAPPLTQVTMASNPSQITSMSPGNPTNPSNPSNPMVPLSFLPMVKVDIKQYPTFNGDNASWAKFKRGVLSIATTHNLDEIFDEKTVLPTPSDPTYTIFHEKNRFVYSIWISRITAGMAMPIIRMHEKEKDGRTIYLKLLEMYEGKNNMRQMAVMAMTKLNTLILTYNYQGGVPTFISNFRNAIQDLHDANEPVSDVLTKSWFLSKIHDKDYSAIVDNLLASNDTYEDCVTRIFDKYNLLSHNKPNQAQTKKVNKVNGRGNQGGRGRGGRGRGGSG